VQDLFDFVNFYTGFYAPGGPGAATRTPPPAPRTPRR